MEGARHGMNADFRRIGLIVGGVALAGFAGAEHALRRIVEWNFWAAQERHARVERQLTERLAKRTESEALLQQQRQHNQEITDALTQKTTQLNDTVGRLGQQTRAVRELEGRLAAMERQVGQLQGELSLALQRVSSAPSGGHAAASIQLERVIIGGDTPAGPQGRVVSIDTDWDFVVFDLGWDTVKVGDTISIVRNDQVLAKARVERVQQDVAAAALLPDWEHAKIQINDVVQVL